MSKIPPWLMGTVAIGVGVGLLDEWQYGVATAAILIGVCLIVKSINKHM